MDAIAQDGETALDMFAKHAPGAPDRAARFLKSLAHRDRLKVLCVLIDAERTVSDIEAAVGASQSAISQHLSRLRDEGIVSARREGRQIFYKIQDPAVLDLVTVLYNRFCAPAAE